MICIVCAILGSMGVFWAKGIVSQDLAPKGYVISIVCILEGLQNINIKLP